MIRWKLFIISGMFTICHSAISQSPAQDTSFVTLAKKNEITRYEKIMVSQSRLYNGTGYREYNSQDDENPYLIDDWTDGSIQYDGEIFHNVPLMFDIRDNKVILEHYSSREKVQLIGNKISWFTLDQRRFVHLTDSATRNGFFELIYNGKIKVYVKWEKYYWEQILVNTIYKYFAIKTLCYIYKDNTYTLVKGKKNVLDVLADHKSELNKFIGKNHLDFKANREKNEYKSNRESSIVRVAEYYDSLTK